MTVYLGEVKLLMFDSSIVSDWIEVMRGHVVSDTLHNTTSHRDGHTKYKLTDTCRLNIYTGCKPVSLIA